MLVEGTVPVQAVESRVATDDPAQAVAVFQQEHPQARVEAIDGKIVRGVCACGRPVMEDTGGFTYSPEDQLYICPRCTGESV